MFRRYQDLLIYKITVIILLTLSFNVTEAAEKQQQPSTKFVNFVLPFPNRRETSKKPQNMNAKLTGHNEEAAKKAEEFLAQWDKKDLPGGAVSVIKDGKLIYKRAFGLANLDYDVPNTTSTLFNVASVSKAFTAFSIGLLAQQGKLSLDDDIRKYVPEIPQYEQTVTIRHLINHTSGIREYQALILFGGLGTDNAYSEKYILNLLARQKNLSFTPGEKWQYSNSGYFLLGVIVSRVSGKSLRAFAEENIFQPLGMKNTLFFDNRFEVVKNRAAGYLVGQDSSVRARSSLFDLVGSGGLLTTVEDLYLWNQNFNEPKVGNKELIAMLTEPGILNSGEKTRYGFGIFLGSYKGLTVTRHSGNLGGYRAQIVTFPEQNFTVVALTNNTAVFPSVIAEKLADIYLEGQFKPASAQPKSGENLPQGIALSEKEARRYEGIYAHPESGKFFKLNIKDGKLINSDFFKKEVAVTAISENKLLFVADNGRTELNPVFSSQGVVSEIKIMSQNGKADNYVPVKPPLSSPEALAEYAGTFYSDELDAEYLISLKGSNLAVQVSESFNFPLTPAYADVFTAANGQINFSFSRDANGKISGFVFNSGVDDRDVKGVVFKRR